MQNTIDRLAELTSLTLTPSTITTGALVCMRWGPKAIEALQTLPEDRQPDQWFIMGVATGFAGSVLDNLYWSIPWTASYMGLDCTQDLVQAGVYFNIFSRQIAGTLAAYFHLRAYDIDRPRAAKVTRWTLITSFATPVAAAALTFAWLW